MSTDNRFVRSFLMLGKAAYAAVKSVPKVSDAYAAVVPGMITAEHASECRG